MTRLYPHRPDFDCRSCGSLAPPCRPPDMRRPDCRHGDCCRDDASVKLHLFDSCTRQGGSCCHPLPPAAPPVTIVNPWNCREYAQVTLSVDECGNLVVYVKR